MLKSNYTMLFICYSQNVIIHILYKIYIFKTWATLKLQKNLSNCRLIFQKMSFQSNFVWAQYQTLPLGHYQSPFPCVLSDLKNYFHNFYTIYEVNILFIGSMGSLADFDMNSTSNKHIQRTCMCVIAHCHITNCEFIIFFFISNFSDLFSKIIKWVLSFDLLA